MADSGPAAFQQFSGEGDFDQWLINAAVQRWQDLFGQAVQPWFYGWGGGPRLFTTGSESSVEFSGVVPLSNEGATATDGSDHSGTNNQVDGVDEADTVQTDGTYLYTAVGSELVIVSADPADQMAVVSRTDVGGEISGIYLNDGKVTVLASVDESGGRLFPGGMSALIGGDVWWQASKTLVATYDVSNAAAPAVVEKTTLDGYLTDSREIDGRVYAVVSNDLWMPPPLVEKQTDGTRVYESESDYRARMKTIVGQRTLPGFTATDAAGDTVNGTFVSVPNMYVSGESSENETLTSVVLIDPSTGAIGPDASATIVGPSGTIYATADSMYVTGWDWDPDSGVEQTDVAKFSLGTGSVTLQAVGTVEGSIIDQFSMGENSHGDLNIATESGWGNDSENDVYTLRQNGTSLDPIGALLNVAPGEDLTSSRFVGDTGYLVTFHNTDPLFTLDLSDPTDPEVAGELDLPGFSEYLQPIGGHYLLGLGESGEDGGLQVSLFDVIDPANPRLVGTYQFDANDPDSGSDAEYDHHAIQYFEAQQILTLPVWKYDAGSDSFVEGTSVLKVDLNSGFTQVGFVTQEGASRQVRIGQTLYTVGDETIVASDLGNPSNVFSTVTIGDDQDGGSASGDALL
jgi:uncharacterized secreted protein with C-terminal beta-propeller domain